MQDISVSLTARDRELYGRLAAEGLPERVFDAHVHAFERACFPPGFDFPPRECYRRFGGEHTLEQFQEATGTLLAGRTAGMLSFGTPHRQCDRAAAARYTGGISDNQTRFGLALVAPEDSVTELEQRLSAHRLIGYKPYRSYVTGLDAEAVRIPHILPAAQMELANALGLAVMLHIPRESRLADPDNQRDMVELCQRYPQAQIIFAHIGRAYWYQNVVGNLDGIARCPNAWLDTAMVNHPEVLHYAFTHFPRERILFGSDAPIAWLRGKSVEINDQYAYLMAEPYAIGTAIHDPGSTVEFTFFYYEMLRAVLEAARRAGWTAADLEGFFWGNGHGLCAGVAERLYGRGLAAPVSG
jgi:predicted TIM-barrel fold metal-dependent hydrolase